MSKLQVEGLGEVNIDSLRAWRVWPEGQELPYLRLQIEIDDKAPVAIWYQYERTDARGEGGETGFTLVGDDRAHELEQRIGAAVAARIKQLGQHEASEDEGSHHD